MPAKRTVDEGLLFLYSCYKHKAGDVDINAVCAENGDLKPATARMRLYRLAQAIEAAQQAGNNGEGVKIGGDEGEVGAAVAGKAKGNVKAKGNGASANGKNKKRKLSDTEDDVEEGSHGVVKVKDED